jgi:hypothetical protein
MQCQSLALKEIEDIHHDHVTWKKFELFLRLDHIHVLVDGKQVNRSIEGRQRGTIFYNWLLYLEKTGPTGKAKKDAFTYQAGRLGFSTSWKGPDLLVTYLNQGLFHVSQRT